MKIKSLIKKIKCNLDIHEGVAEGKICTNRAPFAVAIFRTCKYCGIAFDVHYAAMENIWRLLWEKTSASQWFADNEPRFRIELACYDATQIEIEDIIDAIHEWWPLDNISTDERWNSASDALEWFRRSQ